MMRALLLLFGVAAVSGVVVRQKVTPVEKVVELLETLQTRLEKEAKAEAAQYDKYACFCKEQVDQSVYEDEGHVKHLAELDATIDKLTEDIKALNKEIADLAATITKLEGTIKAEADQRAKDHASYKSWAKELASAISALERAIEAMQNAKDDQSDEVKLDLAQVRATASKLGLKQAPEVYEFRSNDIIATLQDLLKQFLENQKEHDKDEFDANAAWEERDADNNRQKDFAEADKAEKEKISAYKDELKGKAESERDSVRAEQARNLKFLGELKQECQEKANLWDQRSQTRSQELQTISDALSLLKSKVDPNWSANKKLVDVQVKTSVEVPAAPAFVQVKSQRSNLLRAASSKSTRDAAEGSKIVARKAVAFLSSAASKLGSRALALTAVRVSASEDHFVKVRSIINDLISRLQADAKAEQTQKDMCDKGMAEGVKNRDQAQADVEATSATIETKEADKATAVEAIADLSDKIAKMKKAIVEMTELRDEDKAENAETVAMGVEGRKAVESALEMLQDFYDEAENALLQKSAQPRIASAAAKDDKTYADVAPDIFQEHYRGAQKASKGILGLLNTILSDFERTIDTTNDNEADAESKYQGDKITMEGLVKQYEDEKTRQEADVARLSKELIGHEADLKSYKESHQAALDALSALESSCVDGEETYDERVAAREKEIEALKEAHQILEDWKGF